MSDTSIIFDGPLVLTRMPALQEQIATALSARDVVVLDVSAAGEIDISFIQLLISAHKTAKLQHKHLSVAMNGAERLAARIAACGLPESVLPDFRDVFPAGTGAIA